MAQPAFLDTPHGRRIAHHRSDGAQPGIVFLGGFMSDMEGTKATHLEAWATAQGRAFLRFDYSGHGASSGTFEEGAISDWAEDAMAAIGALTDGPQILVGSSMGGWIALLVVAAMPDKVAGLVTIAAAPDFTEDGLWSGLSEADRHTLTEHGAVQVPSPYGDPYPVTRRLIEDGRTNLVLRAPLVVPVPMRMFQGTEDEEVHRNTALALRDHVQCDDVKLTFVDGADHRFSTPECLAMVEAAITDLAETAAT